jgi:hypothetical protein
MLHPLYYLCPGILPHDGKNIKFTELSEKIRTTYNFSSSFCFFVPDFAANMLNKNYKKDTFDLAELDLHSKKSIEHDASLTRTYCFTSDGFNLGLSKFILIPAPGEDSALVPDQSKPHLPFVRELLASASGRDKDGNALLTAKDVSEYSAKRRVDAKATNPDFMLLLNHKLFGSSKCVSPHHLDYLNWLLIRLLLYHGSSSTMLTIFGGRVKDLESILVDERIPEGWESRIRKKMGLTFAAFNFTVFKVEWGVNEKKYQAKVDAEAAAAASASAAEEGATN